MLKFLLLALPLIPVALAHPPSLDRTGSTADPVGCTIRERPMDGGVQLEGVLVSKMPLSGTYAFEVNKRGPAGTSNSSQSGGFSVNPNEETVVGHVGLGMEPGGTYTAELTVSWPGGEVSCIKRHPDRA